MNRILGSWYDHPVLISSNFLVGNREHYFAFISYSHADESHARWLHRALERYRVPGRLIGRETVFGPVPKRLYPVFRDRDELAASKALNEEIENALGASNFLIVLCSPAAAASRWVNEEIRIYKSRGGADRVFALIVDGEPNSGNALECFPEALRFDVDAGGQIVHSAPVEPIAADIWPQGDGRAKARLKLIAGVLGIGLDELRQRELQAAQRRMAAIVLLMAGASAVSTSLYLRAETQREMAEEQRAMAGAINSFVIDEVLGQANPVTGPAGELSYHDLLVRLSESIDDRIGHYPDAAARMYRELGNSFQWLGNLALAEKLKRRGVSILADRYGPGDPRTLIASADLAIVYPVRKTPEGRERLQAARDGLARVYAPNHPYLIALDSWIASQRMPLPDDYEQRIAAFESIARRAAGAPDLAADEVGVFELRVADGKSTVIFPSSFLASLYAAGGRFGPALENIDRWFAGTERLYGETGDMGLGSAVRASYLLGLGRLEEAENMLERADDVIRRWYQHDGGRLPVDRVEVIRAELAIARGQWERARSLIAPLVPCDSGDCHLDLYWQIQALMVLARIDLRDDPAAAIAHLDRAESRFGAFRAANTNIGVPKLRLLGRCKLIRVRALLLSGDVPEAREILDAVAADAGETFYPDSHDYAALHEVQGEVLLAEGRLAEARESFQLALNLQVLRRGETHPVCVRLRQRLDSLERPDRALAE